MKKILSLFSATIITFSLLAQAPQKMSYQAVIRNASTNLVTNAPIKMRISILQGSTTGTVVYSELHSAATNANGLVSIEIGGGTSPQGVFSNINWGNGVYFLKTETDPTNGTNYSIVSTSQLLSVPYALYAGNVVNSGGKPILYIQGDITNTQAQAQIASEFGPNTVEIRIENCSNLTTIDLSALTKIVDLKIYFNPQLQSVNLSNLQFCSSFIISDCPKLSALNISSLKTVSGFDAFFIYKTGLTSLNFNALTSSSSLNISQNNLLSNLSFPVLKKVGYFEISYNTNLNSIGLPLVDSINYINFIDNTPINTISLPALKSVNEFMAIYNNDNLSNINISNLTSFDASGASLFNQKLNSTQINTLLNKFVNITPSLTGKAFSFNTQNPAAPPTGQGIIDKATLISRGNSVQTD
jgi:hypothetical protein